MSDQWYFDTETHEVTQGKQSGWDSRMGPYSSRDAAEAALETARARNTRWDAEDEADD